MRVELGGPDWAEIKEPGELRHADRKAVLRVSVMEISPEDKRAYVNGANDEEMRDELLKRVVTNWSLPLPLPSLDADSLGRLTLDQADKLAEAVKPHMDLIVNRQDPTRRGTDPTAA
jgi:hypothetical protein